MEATPNQSIPRAQRSNKQARKPAGQAQPDPKLDGHAPHPDSDDAGEEPWYHNFPDALTALPQWTVGKLERVTDKSGKVKINKVAYCPQEPTRKASHSNPTTWDTFPVALGVLAAFDFDGLEFAIAADGGLIGLDLDHVRDPKTGVIAPWAQQIITAWATYAEISVSGTGVKLIGRGALPPGKHISEYQDGRIELYDRQRFFFLTGNRLPGAPATIGDLSAETVVNVMALIGDTTTDFSDRGDQDSGPTGMPVDEVLRRCRTDKSGEEFVAFFDRADLSAVDGDNSVADWRVWTKMRFYLGDDPQRILDLSKQGAHYLHPEDPAEAKKRKVKWNRPNQKHGTFAAAQIAKLIDQCVRDGIPVFGGKAKGEVGVGHPYLRKHGVLCRRVMKTKYDKNGNERKVKVPSPLCTFDAAIAVEETADDGAEVHKRFEIVGSLPSGQTLPPVLVSADHYGAMDWVSEWGVRAVIMAGRGNRDHLRAAVRLAQDSVLLRDRAALLYALRYEAQRRRDRDPLRRDCLDVQIVLYVSTACATSILSASASVSVYQAGCAMPTKAPASAARAASDGPVSSGSVGAKLSGSPTASRCQNSPCSVSGACNSAPSNVVKLAWR